MNHVMIDLETIGNDIDGIFTTIGACTFDPVTGDIGKTFYTHVNWESAVEAGRTITPDTVKWWMGQPEEARKEIVQDGLPLADALTLLKSWLPEEAVVWGNGPLFDIAKLEHAFGYYNIPWKFYNVRCVRTICDLAKGRVSREDIPFNGDKHNALDDAVHQAKYVSAMWQALRSKVKPKEQNA